MLVKLTPARISFTNMLNGNKLDIKILKKYYNLLPSSSTEGYFFRYIVIIIILFHSLRFFRPKYDFPSKILPPFKISRHMKSKLLA